MDDPQALDQRELRARYEALRDQTAAAEADIRDAIQRGDGRSVREAQERRDRLRDKAMVTVSRLT